MATKSAMIVWQLKNHPNVNIPSMIYWDSGTPLEILLVIQTGEGTRDKVEWRFGRDLLLDAISKNKAGEADVRVRVDDNDMHVHLESPFGEVDLVTDASHVGQFLAGTLLVVPRGGETCDVDGAIAKIFEDLV
jgi:hypothetical protein